MVLLRLHQHVASMLLGLFILGLSSCKEQPPTIEERGEQSSVIEVGGINVPVFQTAEEQLNYTRSWFADITEKRATLKAFLSLYPENREYCGMASLDLAYLELGSDYRLAYEHASFAAIKAYKDVINEFPEIPGIQAKAHWYIGWIYSDLIGDTGKGIEYYQSVVNRFSEEEVLLLSPAPWVSIIYPDDDAINTALANLPPNTWASLALVEIIRHSNNEELAWSSFLTLWRKYRENVATGFGLKLILERRIHVEKATNLAREYMEKNFSNVHILSDIQKLIQEIDYSEESA